jgi:hypothetical protein
MAPEANCDVAPRRNVELAHHTGLFKTSNFRAVESVLVHRLWRTDTVEFRRSICGHHEQRNECLIGFGDARQQFRRRRATRHHYRDGTIGREGPADREETGTALVDAHVHRQFCPLGADHHERC